MNVGIIGAGQLARMLAMAGHALGIDCHCTANNLNDSASGVSMLSVIDLQNKNALKTFCDSVDVVTLENENVDIHLAEQIAAIKPLRPGIKALRMSQDRLLEKEGLTRLNIPVSPYRDINSQEDLTQAVDALGFPAILKTRRFGYDGKGQFRLNTAEDIQKAWETLGGQPLVLEAFVDFECEVSIVAARRLSGDIVFYPLAQNTHHQGILRESKAPFADQILQAQAEQYAKDLLVDLNYVGVLAIEFFVKHNQLIANEFAPRVHNTGHWTIEGAETSQFENHLRAILDLPLGATTMRAPSIMLNAIGNMPEREFILGFPHAHYHDYKKSARPNRKVGHVTFVGEAVDPAVRELMFS